MSDVDFSSREVTFTWSGIAHYCPAMSYNILSSNCGSCPTTTNHTNVTCTVVYVSPGDTCTFAVQTVVNLCGRTTRNTSNSISVNLTSLINLDAHTCVNQSSTISTISLATALMVSLVVSITVIVVCCIVIVICCIILTRKKAEIKALKLQLTTTAERKPQVESGHDDVIRTLPSTGAINTQDNAAYGTAKPSIGAINTQDNAAYCRTKYEITLCELTNWENFLMIHEYQTFLQWTSQPSFVSINQVLCRHTCLQSTPIILLAYNIYTFSTMNTVCTTWNFVNKTSARNNDYGDEVSKDVQINNAHCTIPLVPWL